MHEKDPDDRETLAASPLGSTVHQRIGPYRLQRLLGEGGMGEVWEAEQEKPVRRKVALKLIKWGMDTKSVVARFEVERQALALMSHPNVAKVFDAGATERGRPYFAMELVRGVPITKHCDKHELSTRERLELFTQVCDGVQHAHQKGIIHRDIKPSNILVQLDGDRRTPKIIDFGVAKATQQRLTERTVFTEFGQLIGTPEYMSPEQADMTIEDIDTRTDVYSLGVLLYRLLVGSVPFDSTELRSADPEEVRRRIRGEPPSRPSARIDGRGEAARSLRKQLRGDLDWIVMKALEKDRTRRYGSPAELAADVRAHLEHRPVLAGPPGTLYRATKFARRHRIGVVVAVLVFASLAGLALRERIQSNRIAREAETASQVSEFLVDLFKVSEPGQALGNSVTAREILDQGAARIDDELVDQPLVRARLMYTIGRVYRQLGLYDEALPLWEQALRSRRELLGDEHSETLSAMTNLATLYRRLGRHDEAETVALEAAETSRRVLGDEHPETLSALNTLATVYSVQGRSDEAEPLMVQTLEIRRRTLGNEHENTQVSMNNLAVEYKRRGRFDLAEPLYVESLTIRRRLLGGDHPRTLVAMNNLAVLYKNMKRYEESERLYTEALEAHERVLGKEHPDTLRLLNNLGVLYKNQKRYDEAERVLLDTSAAYARTLGQEHPQTLNVANNLALVYHDQQRYDKAEEQHLRMLEANRRVRGAEHPITVATLNNLGLLYHDQGRLAEAEQLWREVLEIRRRVLGPQHRDTWASIFNMGRITALRGDHESALGFLREALDHGWAEKDLFSDKDFDALRDMPEFETMVAEVRQRKTGAGEKRR